MIQIMALKIFLFLLPVLTYGHINIKITTSNNMKHAFVMATGKNVQIISDKERETFKINDWHLNNILKRKTGVRPDKVFVKNPTPREDLYASHKWQQVQRTITPKHAKVSFTSEPVIISTKRFYNNNTNTNVKFIASISQQKENTLKTTWLKPLQLSGNPKVSYSTTAGLGTIVDKTSFSFQALWGKPTTKTEEISLGLKTLVELSLEPGESAEAVLKATKGTLRAEVEYAVTVDGDFVASYSNPYNGHYFWAHEVKEILKDRQRSFVVKEIIEIQFYCDERVDVL